MNQNPYQTPATLVVEGTAFVVNKAKWLRIVTTFQILACISSGLFVRYEPIWPQGAQLLLLPPLIAVVTVVAVIILAIRERQLSVWQLTGILLVEFLIVCTLFLALLPTVQ